MKKVINRILKLAGNTRLLLIFVLLAGFLVRLYKIDNPIADWHSWRQADTASVSRNFVDTGINLLAPKYHDISSIQTGYFNPEGYRLVEFPLYNAIHAVLFNNIGSFSFEVWGRLVSIFSTLLSTYLLYLLARRFISPIGGVLAAFFFAMLPFNIYFSRVILPEPLAVTLGLMSLWYFVQFIDTDKFTSLFLSGVFLALSALVKPFTLFYATPMVYLLLDKYSSQALLLNSKLLIKLLVFTNVIVAPLLLWRGWISLHPEGIPFWKWAFNGDKIRFRPSFWRWIIGERLGRLILGVWGVVPFTFGLLKTKSGKYFSYTFLFGALLYVVLVATANVRHDYYQTIVIAPIALVLAKGTLNMWNTREFNKGLSRLILIGSLAMMLLVGLVQTRELYKINRPEIVRAGEAVDRLAAKDALVVAPYNGDTAFLYQTGRWGWPFMDRDIDTLIKYGADYFVSVNLHDTQTLEIIDRFNVVEETPEYIIADLHQPK